MENRNRLSEEAIKALTVDAQSHFEKIKASRLDCKTVIGGEYNPFKMSDVKDMFLQDDHPHILTAELPMRFNPFTHRSKYDDILISKDQMDILSEPTQNFSRLEDKRDEVNNHVQYLCNQICPNTQFIDLEVHQAIMVAKVKHKKPITDVTKDEVLNILYSELSSRHYWDEAIYQITYEEAIEWDSAKASPVDEIKQLMDKVGATSVAVGMCPSAGVNLPYALSSRLQPVKPISGKILDIEDDIYGLINIDITKVVEEQRGYLLKEDKPLRPEYEYGHYRKFDKRKKR